MSWITPNTSWSDSDTPTPSDFDRIEGNTDYLKDAVDSNDSDILSNASSIASIETALASEVSTRGSADTALSNRIDPLEAWTNQGVNTTDSPTFAGLTLTGAFNPETTPSSGSWAAFPQVIPRGIYQMVGVGATDIEIYVSGAWRTIASSEQFNGAVISDGTNVRANGAGGTTMYYLKF